MTWICFSEFLHLTMDAGLIDACRMLIENNIHRLPIIDPVSGDIFSILNQKPLLKFLFNIPKVRTLSHLNSTIEEAGVGSFDNIAVSYIKMWLNVFSEALFKLFILYCRWHIRKQKLSRR